MCFSVFFPCAVNSPCVGVCSSLSPLQKQLLSVLFRSAIHYTYWRLALKGRAAWSSSRVLRSLYLSVSSWFTLFPPFCFLSCTHTGSLIYLSFVNSSSLFTSFSGIQFTHLLQLLIRSLSMTVSFLISLLIICGSNPCKETPLPHISPSSSLTRVFNIFVPLFFTFDSMQEVVLTSSQRWVFLMDQAYRVSVSLPRTNKAVLQGQQY